MKRIIKKQKELKYLVVLLLSSLFISCDSNDNLSEREIAMELLTNNSSKYWVFDKSNVDGQPIIPSECDSSYMLLMKSDFTWEEIYLILQCNRPGNGSWTLSEQNDVISIEFINQNTGLKEEKHFEIEELSDKYLAYQFAENNRLRYVRLKNSN